MVHKKMRNAFHAGRFRCTQTCSGAKFYARRLTENGISEKAGASVGNTLTLKKTFECHGYRLTNSIKTSIFFEKPCVIFKVKKSEQVKFFCIFYREQ